MLPTGTHRRKEDYYEKDKNFCGSNSSSYDYRGHERV